MDTATAGITPEIVEAHGLQDVFVFLGVEAVLLDDFGSDLGHGSGP